MQDYSKIWNQVLDKLEFEFDSEIFNEVFSPCTVHEFRSGSIYIITPNEYIKTRLNKLYIYRVNEIVSQLITDEIVRVKFITKDEIKIEPKINTPEPNLINKYRNNLNANLDKLNSDTKDAVNNFLASYIEGTSMRDTSGVCHSCTTPNTVTTTKEQCLHCPGRTFKMTNTTTTAGTCSFGGCQTDEFVNISSGCPKCSSTANSYISTTYQLSANSTAKCSECDEKQIMTQNSTGNIYCVPNNCSKGYEWQHTSSGKCVNCNDDNSVKEIGVEEIYQTQCRECGRMVFNKTENNKTIWYCSKIYEEGTNFVNSNGEISSCTAGDTQIPNTQDAKNLCKACIDIARIVETDDDGTVWCVKA